LKNLNNKKMKNSLKDKSERGFIPILIGFCGGLLFFFIIGLMIYAFVALIPCMACHYAGKIPLVGWLAEKALDTMTNWCSKCDLPLCWQDSFGRLACRESTGHNDQLVQQM